MLRNTDDHSAVALQAIAISKYADRQGLKAYRRANAKQLIPNLLKAIIAKLRQTNRNAN